MAAFDASGFYIYLILTTISDDDKLAIAGFYFHCRFIYIAFIKLLLYIST